MRSKTYKKNDKDTKGSSSVKNKKWSKDKSSKSGSGDTRMRVHSNDKNAPTANLKQGDRDNDPNWYFTSPELANQASQLSFQSLIGYGGLYDYKVPSIARVNTVMTPGVTYQPMYSTHKEFATFDQSTLESVAPISAGKAGVNLMAAKLYTTLSSFTGRTASYGPQDVAMMILQIASIAEISEAIRRIFGVVLTYNTRNRTVPLGLIKSMGVSAGNVKNNLSIYRMRFNVAMSRINQIPLLENIAFIKKSRDLYQRIYMDDPTNMSQLFYYMPSYYFVLDEAGDTDGSVLKAKPFTARSGNVLPMDNLLVKLEEQITAALESSTLNFIYADLLNMANKLNVTTWQFDYLAENYVVMPEYNQNALLQFHNLTIMGYPMSVTDPNDVNVGVKAKITSLSTSQKSVYVTNEADIFCDAKANDVVYNPLFEASRINAYAWMVDMPNDNPTVEDRIEALRYVGCNYGTYVLPSSISGGTILANGYAFNILPDHYVMDVLLFNNIDTSVTALNAMYISESILPDASSVNLDNLSQLTQFEHAPLVANCNARQELEHIFGGLQFYTMYDADYIKRVLDIMMVGLWDFRV